jgi:hypothetical protein
MDFDRGTTVTDFSGALTGIQGSGPTITRLGKKNPPQRTDWGGKKRVEISF